MGHILPGSFFIFFSFWHIVNIFVRYYKSRRKQGPPFRSYVTYPCSCLCGRFREWEIEGLLKIVFCSIGFTGEIITAYHDGQFVHYGNGQHATMFFFFGLSGVTDIVRHSRIPLPKNVDYVASCLALIVEAVLFKFHLHGRTELDVLVHTLLLYAVYCNIIAVMVEMRYRNHVLVSLTSSFCLMLQGTWFWQVGFILYNPIPGAVDWKQDDHNQMMLACMIFTWHMGALFVFMAATGAVVSCCYQAWNDDPVENHYQMQRLIKQDSNGQNMVDINDTDSDVEFQRPITTADSN